MKIKETISKEEYKEVQTFYFYNKCKYGFWIVLGTIFCYGVSIINIISSRELSIGCIVFMLIPIISILLTNRKINSVVEKLYDKDIKEWEFDITKDYISARPAGSKQFVKVNSRDWYRAYELKSVIILYFNIHQFFTISKNVLNDDELMEVKGYIYDRLGNKFKLKNKR